MVLNIFLTIKFYIYYDNKYCKYKIGNFLGIIRHSKNDYKKIPKSHFFPVNLSFNIYNILNHYDFKNFHKKKCVFFEFYKSPQNIKNGHFILSKSLKNLQI